MTSPLIGRCWAYHEALRRLGFPPEQIYVQSTIDATSERRCLFVLLLPEGVDADRNPKPGPRFVINAGFDDEPHQTKAEWREWVARLRTIPQAELDGRWYDTFPSETRLGELVRGLVAAGFPIPALGIENEPAHYVDPDEEGAVVCGNAAPIVCTFDREKVRCRDCLAKLGN